MKNVLHNVILVAFSLFSCIHAPDQLVTQTSNMQVESDIPMLIYQYILMLQEHFIRSSYGLLACWQNSRIICVIYVQHDMYCLLYILHDDLLCIQQHTYKQSAWQCLAQVTGDEGPCMGSIPEMSIFLGRVGCQIENSGLSHTKVLFLQQHFAQSSSGQYTELMNTHSTHIAQAITHRR